MYANPIAKNESNFNGANNEKIGTREITSYGLGGFAFEAGFTLTIYFLAFYYTDIIGISAAFIGTLALIIRIWDGVTDVAMGLLIDRTKTKYGKARPYILWFGIPYALSIILLFTVPSNLGTTGKNTYIIIFYSFFVLMYTAVSISVKTLLGQITQNQESRTKLGLSIAYGMMSASLIISVSAEPIASAIGGRIGWIIVASLVGLMALLSSYIAFKFTRERVDNQTTEKQEKKNSLKLELKMLLKNKYWIIATLFGIVLYTLYGLLSAEIYYARYIFGNASYYSFIAMAQLIPGIIILILATPFIKRIGKQKTAMLGAIFIILDGLIKLIEPTSLTFYLIGESCLGIGTGFISASIYAMVNDTVDYGEWKTKVRSPGLANSSTSFMVKLGTGLGGAAMGWLLSLSGYVGATSVQTESTMQMIKFLNVHAHLIVGILMLIIILFYKLDKIYPKIIADLQKNHSTP